MLVWIDTETTGVDYKKSLLLEVGVVVTDDDLNIVGSDSLLIRQSPRKVRRSMDDFVTNLHTKSGLLFDLAGGMSYSLSDAEIYLNATLDLLGADDKGLIMAGNSISFDRRFLERDLPTFYKRFSHQSLDVTSVSHAIRRALPAVYKELKAQQSDVAHRAIDDLLSSINQLRWYRDKGFRPAE